MENRLAIAMEELQSQASFSSQGAVPSTESKFQGQGCQKSSTPNDHLSTSGSRQKEMAESAPVDSDPEGGEEGIHYAS
jgi:hypothetical protein